MDESLLLDLATAYGLIHPKKIFHLLVIMFTYLGLVGAWVYYRNHGQGEEEYPADCKEFDSSETTGEFCVDAEGPATSDFVNKSENFDLFENDLFDQYLFETQTEDSADENEDIDVPDDHGDIIVCIANQSDCLETNDCFVDDEIDDKQFAENYDGSLSGKKTGGKQCEEEVCLEKIENTDVFLENNPWDLHEKEIELGFLEPKLEDLGDAFIESNENNYGREGNIVPRDSFEIGHPERDDHGFEELSPTAEHQNRSENKEDIASTSDFVKCKSNPEYVGENFIWCKLDGNLSSDGEEVSTLPVIIISNFDEDKQLQHEENPDFGGSPLGVNVCNDQEGQNLSGSSEFKDDQFETATEELKTSTFKSQGDLGHEKIEARTDENVVVSPVQTKESNDSVSVEDISQHDSQISTGLNQLNSTSITDWIGFQCEINDNESEVLEGFCEISDGYSETRDCFGEITQDITEEGSILTEICSEFPDGYSEIHDKDKERCLAEPDDTKIERNGHEAFARNDDNQSEFTEGYSEVSKGFRDIYDDFNDVLENASVITDLCSEIPDGYSECFDEQSEISEEHIEISDIGETTDDTGETSCETDDTCDESGGDTSGQSEDPPGDTSASPDETGDEPEKSDDAPDDSENATQNTTDENTSGETCNEANDELIHFGETGELNNRYEESNKKCDVLEETVDTSEDENTSSCTVGSFIYDCLESEVSTCAEEITSNIAEDSELSVDNSDFEDEITPVSENAVNLAVEDFELSEENFKIDRESDQKDIITVASGSEIAETTSESDYFVTCSEGEGIKQLCEVDIFNEAFDVDNYNFSGEVSNKFDFVALDQDGNNCVKMLEERNSETYFADEEKIEKEEIANHKAQDIVSSVDEQFDVVETSDSTESCDEIEYNILVSSDEVPTEDSDSDNEVGHFGDAKISDNVGVDQIIVLETIEEIVTDLEASPSSLEIVNRNDSDNTGSETFVVRVTNKRDSDYTHFVAFNWREHKLSIYSCSKDLQFLSNMQSLFLRPAAFVGVLNNHDALISHCEDDNKCKKIEEKLKKRADLQLAVFNCKSYTAKNSQGISEKRVKSNENSLEHSFIGFTNGCVSLTGCFGSTCKDLIVRKKNLTFQLIDARPQEIQDSLLEGDNNNLKTYHEENECHASSFYDDVKANCADDNEHEKTRSPTACNKQNYFDDYVFHSTISIAALDTESESYSSWTSSDEYLEGEATQFYESDIDEREPDVVPDVNQQRSKTLKRPSESDFELDLSPKKRQQLLLDFENRNKAISKDYFDIPFERKYEFSDNEYIQDYFAYEEREADPEVATKGSQATDISTHVPVNNEDKSDVSFNLTPDQVSFALSACPDNTSANMGQATSCGLITEPKGTLFMPVSSSALRGVSVRSQGDYTVINYKNTRFSPVVSVERKIEITLQVPVSGERRNDDNNANRAVCRTGIHEPKSLNTNTNNSIHAEKCELNASNHVEKQNDSVPKTTVEDVFFESAVEIPVEAKMSESFGYETAPGNSVETLLDEKGKDDFQTVLAIVRGDGSSRSEFERYFDENHAKGQKLTKNNTSAQQENLNTSFSPECFDSNYDDRSYAPSGENENSKTLIVNTPRVESDNDSMQAATNNKGLITEKCHRFIPFDNNHCRDADNSFGEFITTDDRYPSITSDESKQTSANFNHTQTVVESRKNGLCNIPRARSRSLSSLPDTLNRPMAWFYRNRKVSDSSDEASVKVWSYGTLRRTKSAEINRKKPKIILSMNFDRRPIKETNLDDLMKSLESFKPRERPTKIAGKLGKDVNNEENKLKGHDSDQNGEQANFAEKRNTDETTTLPFSRNRFDKKVASVTNLIKKFEDRPKTQRKIVIETKTTPERETSQQSKNPVELIRNSKHLTQISAAEKLQNIYNNNTMVDEIETEEIVSRNAFVGPMFVDIDQLTTQWSTTNGAEEIKNISSSDTKKGLSTEDKTVVSKIIDLGIKNEKEFAETKETGISFENQNVSEIINEKERKDFVNGDIFEVAGETNDLGNSSVVRKNKTTKQDVLPDTQGEEEEKRTSVYGFAVFLSELSPKKHLHDNMNEVDVSVQSPLDKKAGNFWMENAENNNREVNQKVTDIDVLLKSPKDLGYFDALDGGNDLGQDRKRNSCKICGAGIAIISNEDECIDCAENRPAEEQTDRDDMDKKIKRSGSSFRRDKRLRKWLEEKPGSLYSQGKKALDDMDSEDRTKLLKKLASSKGVYIENHDIEGRLRNSRESRNSEFLEQLKYLINFEDETYDVQTKGLGFTGKEQNAIELLIEYEKSRQLRKGRSPMTSDDEGNDSDAFTDITDTSLSDYGRSRQSLNSLSWSRGSLHKSRSIEVEEEEDFEEPRMVVEERLETAKVPNTESINNEIINDLEFHTEFVSNQNASPPHIFTSEVKVETSEEEKLASVLFPDQDISSLISQGNYAVRNRRGRSSRERSPNLMINNDTKPRSKSFGEYKISSDRDDVSVECKNNSFDSFAHAIKARSIPIENADWRNAGNIYVDSPCSLLKERLNDASYGNLRGKLNLTQGIFQFDAENHAKMSPTSTEIRNNIPFDSTDSQPLPSPRNQQLKSSPQFTRSTSSLRVQSVMNEDLAKSDRGLHSMPSNPPRYVRQSQFRKSTGSYNDRNHTCRSLPDLLSKPGETDAVAPVLLARYPSGDPSSISVQKQSQFSAPRSAPRLQRSHGSPSNRSSLRSPIRSPIRSPFRSPVRSPLRSPRLSDDENDFADTDTVFSDFTGCFSDSSMDIGMPPDGYEVLDENFYIPRDQNVLPTMNDFNESDGGSSGEYFVPLNTDSKRPEGRLISCGFPPCRNKEHVDWSQRTDFTSCVSCFTYYCSKECRKAHWKEHRATCYYGRVNYYTKALIRRFETNSDVNAKLSQTALEGFQREGRGCILITFSSPMAAKFFLVSGTNTFTKEPVFVTLREVANERIITKHQVLLQQTLQDYNPDFEFIVNLTVFVGKQNEMIKSPKSRFNTSALLRCTKVPLNSIYLSNNVDFPSPTSYEIKVFYLPCSKNHHFINDTEARRYYCREVSDGLKKYGIQLKRDFADVYDKLCLYVEHNMEFVPITLYGQSNRKNYKCVIFPEGFGGSSGTLELQGRGMIV